MILTLKNMEKLLLNPNLNFELMQSSYLFTLQGHQDGFINDTKWKVLKDMSFLTKVKRNNKIFEFKGHQQYREQTNE